MECAVRAAALKRTLEPPTSAAAAPPALRLAQSADSADGSEERGLFWATDKALFVASVKGLAGKLGSAETFLYGFEAK